MVAPTQYPSGDKKGPRRPGTPGPGRHSSSSRTRHHSSNRNSYNNHESESDSDNHHANSGSHHTPTPARGRGRFPFTTTDPTYDPAPGFDHVVTSTPGGLVIETLGPSKTQPQTQPQVQPQFPSQAAAPFNQAAAPFNQAAPFYQAAPFNAPPPSSDPYAAARAFQQSFANSTKGNASPSPPKPRPAVLNTAGNPINNYPHPSQYYPSVNMPPMPDTTLSSGAMPNPYAQHFQPPVPDTTNGPIEHLYVPRKDPPHVEWAMDQGIPLNQIPGVQPGYSGYPGYQPGFQPGHPGFYPGYQPGFHGAPNAYHQAGMATAPMAMPQGQMPYYGQPPMTAGGHCHHGCAAAPGAPGGGPPMWPGQVGGQPGPAPPMGYSMVTGNGGPPAPGPVTPGPPDVMGVGKTRFELRSELAAAAVFNGCNEPQDIKPADDDPSRMYWCKELDGNWTQRNRVAIDKMENWRWYVMPNGVFYAKALVE
ncbi:hypothetical protein F4780DRAFT_550975 [Xylariomycetidae sp. FL0641]|nr:hypothetical protein F4780DRAFT_550975 [Xylariomycetidae sp. FL0641]